MHYSGGAYVDFEFVKCVLVMGMYSGRQSVRHQALVCIYRRRQLQLALACSIRTSLIRVLELGARVSRSFSIVK
jgi:hypothetical protein